MSLTGMCVARVCEQLWQRGRYPSMIQMVKRPAFFSKALDAWAHEHGAKHAAHAAGKPVEDTYIAGLMGACAKRV